MRVHRRVAAIAAAVVCSAMAASPAAAATYELSGTQVGVDTGLFLNFGGLLGVWQVTSFVADDDAAPLFHGTGTETFWGCLNLDNDHSCYKEPMGSLKFSFEYWAKFGSADPDSLVWGACFHPIVSGERAFAGAQGVLTMVDSPTPRGAHTRWQATLTLPDTAAARAANRGGAHRLRVDQMLRRHRPHARVTGLPRMPCGGH